MIFDFSERTAMLLGDGALEVLADSRVAVFGLGGVGGSAAEALVRAGIGHIDVIDNDTVSLSNLNRQLLATRDTVGQLKTEAARERFLKINPRLDIGRYSVYYDSFTADLIDLLRYKYIVDAIDSVTSKLLLITRASDAGVPVISSMGTGNKLHPELLRVGDIYETSVCPLARVMRYELRRRGVEHLTVVWSPEEPVPSDERSEQTGKAVPGSVSFVPPVAGYIAAGEVIKGLLKY